MNGPSINPRFFVTAGLLALGLAPATLMPRAGEALRDDHKSRADLERMERGYYEALLDEGSRIDRLDQTGSTHAARRIPFDAGPLCLVVDDIREYVLKPGVSMTHAGAVWSTNAFGMRDRERDLVKPPGTFRIALLGDSIGAGWGVDDDHVFASLLEHSLRAQSEKRGGGAVEVWNFSVPGHAPGQRWEDFERLGSEMGADLLIYEATPADPGWDEHRLRGLLPRGLGWDAPQYRDALAAAGVRPGGDFESYKRALRPYRWQILENVYRTIAGSCRARGVPSVWVLIPRVGRPADSGERRRLVELARRSGFTAVFDLSDSFDGLEAADLAIAPDDYHPNAGGHARLARRIEAALEARPELLRSSDGAGVSSP